MRPTNLQSEYIEEREFREAQIARLDGIKHKRIVFTSASLRSRRGKARLHKRGVLSFVG